MTHYIPDLFISLKQSEIRVHRTAILPTYTQDISHTSIKNTMVTKLKSSESHLLAPVWRTLSILCVQQTPHSDCLALFFSQPLY